MSQSHSYGLGELCSLADVSARTVRYYISQGLLPPPSGAGPAARYGDRHLDRLRLIKRLQREHLPLAEIRSRLSALSDDDVATLANEDSAAASPDALRGGQVEAPSDRGSALEYIRSILGTSGDAGPGDTLRAKLLFAMHTGRPAARHALEQRLYGSVRAPRPADGDLDVCAVAPTPPGASSTPNRPGEMEETIDRSDEEGAGTRASGAVPSGGPASESGTPARSQWDRIALTPDIELHIRRPLSRLQNRRVERLVLIARELLEED